MKKIFWIFILAVLGCVCSYALGTQNVVEDAHNHNGTECHQCVEESHSAWDCQHCGGTGRDKSRSCYKCKGRGTVEVQVPCVNRCSNGRVQDRYGNWVTCNVCGGSGFNWQTYGCDACDGWGHPRCPYCGGSGKQ